MDIPEAASAAANAVRVVSGDATTAALDVVTTEGKIITYYKAHIPALCAGAGAIVGFVAAHFLKF